MVLMGDRLHQVVDSIQLGRAALGKIKQNLAWALAYNVIGIPLAAGVCVCVCACMSTFHSAPTQRALST